jgi:hypothetical protein
MADDFELDTGESVDMSSSTFWRDPERLRRAADHFKAKAANPPRWYKPPEPEPVKARQPCISDQLIRRIDNAIHGRRCGGLARGRCDVSDSPSLA